MQDASTFCLPSPTPWADGNISGLRARGNFGVDIDWKNGKLRQATITSGSGEQCTVRYGQQSMQFLTKRGKTYLVTMENGRLTMKQK